MNKTISFFLLLFFLLISGSVHATSNDKPRPFEEIFPEIGYKSVEEAVREFENHFKQDVKLPLRVPLINFTHYFGRFSDLDGDINDSLEVKYISDKSPENHYKINVRTIKNKIPIKKKVVSKTFELKNGNQAIYSTISGFNVLAFEKDNLQYTLSVDNRVSYKVSPEILVEIANSSDYPVERKSSLFN